MTWLKREARPYGVENLIRSRADGAGGPNVRTRLEMAGCARLYSIAACLLIPKERLTKADRSGAVNDKVVEVWWQWYLYGIKRFQAASDTVGCSEDNKHWHDERRRCDEHSNDGF